MEANADLSDKFHTSYQMTVVSLSDSSLKDPYSIPVYKKS